MRGLTILGMITGGLLLVTLGGVWLGSRPPLPIDLLKAEKIAQPDMRVQDVHLWEQTEAGDTWEIVAQEAAWYDAQQLTRVQQIQAHAVLPNAAQALHVVADSGQIDHTTGNFILRGHVHLLYLDAYTVVTEILYWHAASHSVSTPVSVMVESASVQIAGVGFLGQTEEQRFVLQDEVHATFYRR